MLPLAHDVSRLPIVLVGHGAAALKRLAMLRAAGAEQIQLFAPDGDQALLAEGARRGLPPEPVLSVAGLLFVAGLDQVRQTALAGLAREYAIPVNVEDVPSLCDFHVPAIVQRGNLTISVATGGGSPALASRLRAWLEAALPEVWGERLGLLAAERNRLRAAGASMAAVRAAADRVIDGWLPSPPAGGGVR